MAKRPPRSRCRRKSGGTLDHLTALIAYWTVVCRVPRRLVETMLADVLGLEISLGSTQKAWEEVSQAVAQPCQQWQEQLPREAVRNVDETGWRSNGDKRWIWTFVAKQFRLWYRFRGDLRDRRGNPQPINRRQLLRKSMPLQKKLFALAETHLDHANKEVRNLATALYVHCERWFTFLEVKGVEPTNN